MVVWEPALDPQLLNAFLPPPIFLIGDSFGPGGGVPAIDPPLLEAFSSKWTAYISDLWRKLSIVKINCTSQIPSYGDT